MSVERSLASLKAVREKLERLKANIEDLDPLWDRFADIMVEETAELWATEGDTAVPPWAPLAPSTVAKKMRMGVPLEPMIESGDLLESLLDEGEAARFSQGRSTLGTFTQKTFSWGTDVEYAAYHQEGPEHNPNLPVRNVINVTPALLARIDDAAEDWIRDMVREAGIR